ncbi:MAG TPA: hypothetical protein VJS47_01190 [Rhizomicrobium sp.]|nr:hypothetical protein [Rhizomicrobium sp.]
MSIPITGTVLIPLGLILAMLPWRFCLAGLVVFTMMSPAAVVNVGKFGLQPGYYLSLLLIGRTALQVITERLTLNGFVISQMRPLFWFIATTFAVLFIALCFFQGSIETLPGTAGYKSGLTRPFQLARENFTQLTYLILNACLVYSMAHAGARQKPLQLVTAWDRAIMCGLLFAAAVCVWQFVALYGGFYFPTDFFYSNAGYSRADSQSMVGLFRINGPFEEPSVLGYNFSGFLLYAWARNRLHPTGPSLAMIAACIFCLVMSTATSAYMGLFLFAAVALFDAAKREKVFQRAKRKISSLYLVVIAFIFVGLLGGAVVVADNWQAIEFILKTTLFNKSGSNSFQQRSYADYLALQVFAQTYGIGIGLGSHKGNSLLLTLISNTGVVGILLFGTFVYARFRWKATLEPGLPPAVAAASVRPFKLGLLGLLAIHLVSNPNLSVLALWISMGGLLALQASERRQGFAARRDPMPAKDFSPSGNPYPSHAPV